MTESSSHPALEDPAALWQPFGFMVRREPSSAGDVDLRADIASALRVRGVVGALADGAVAALPGWCMVRVAIDDGGRVATAGGGLPPRPSIQVEELVSALARHVGVVAVIDEENAVGTDGRPVASEEVAPQADQGDGDTRFVFAWPGSDLLGARAIAGGLGRPVTAYRHGNWVIALAGLGVDAEVGPPTAWGFGFPFVVMSRTGEVRAVTYTAGKGRKALELDLSWAPPLAPVLPDHDGDGAAVRHLAEWLSTARLGLDDLPSHPQLDDTLADALVTATTVPDGHGFLGRIGALLDVPPLVAELVEDQPGAALVGPGERIEPSSASALIGAAFRAELSREPAGRDPFSRLRRLFRRRPGWHLAFGLLELVLSAVAWVSLLGAWSAVPGWLRLTAAILLTIDGVGNTALAAHRLRQLRRTAKDGPADS
jgi:hypothetical protein